MDRLLDLFDKHKYGIIGTLFLHTIIVGALHVTTFRTQPAPDDRSELYMELDPEALEKLLEQIEEQQLQQQEYEAQEVKNLSNNSTMERLAQADKIRYDRHIESRVAESIEEELKELEQSEFEKLQEDRAERGEEVEMPTLDPEKWKKENYMPPPKPMAVEGPTTVTYDLKDRWHQRIHIPAYLCKGHGKVVLNFSVDRSGNVEKATLNPGATTTTDDCMITYAIESAERARFNGDGNAAKSQSGTITFLFVPQ